MPAERLPEQDVTVGEEALRKAEEFVEQEEGAVRRFSGWLQILITVVAVAMSLYHLYAAYAIIPAHILRATHVGFVLFLLFLLFPASKRFRSRVQWFDIVLSLVGVATIAYLLIDFDDFIERAVTPNRRALPVQNSRRNECSNCSKIVDPRTYAEAVDIEHR